MVVVALAGCSPTTIVVNVTLDAHDAAPATLTASLYDARHAVIRDHAVATRLPGRLTLIDLPATAEPLRLALDGSGGLEAGVPLEIAPNATVMASALLSSSTLDRDHDGVPDNIDNCPTVANGDQANSGGGPSGDACRAGDLAAPPGSDLGGVVTASCPPGAIVCDGFDSAPGSVWSNDHDALITVTNDAVHVHRGAAALHYHIGPTTMTYVQADLSEQKSQPQPETWLRVFVYVPTATEPYNTSLIELYESDGAPFGYVGLGLDTGGHLELFDTVSPSMSMSSTAPFPTDRWVCVEWRFKELPSSTDLAKQSGEAQVWLDGNELTELHLTSGLNGPSPFATLMLGMTVNNQEPGGGDVWYDDFAVGATRMGCN